MKANAQQIKIIHSLKNKLHLDEETYRGVLESYSVQSSKELDLSDACKLIQQWAKLGEQLGVWNNRQKNRFKHLKNRSPHMATVKQLRMIQAMWRDVSRMPNATAREVALNAFIKRIVGISNIEWLEKLDIPKIIKAIQTMKNNKENNYGTNTCDTNQ